MAQPTKEVQRYKLLQEIKETQRRQPDYRFGPLYIAARGAVRGEVPDSGVSGTLPARKLGRAINAASTPEKFFAALALYHPRLFELHDQHVYYAGPKHHPLQRHPKYSSRVWPRTEGTFAIAEDFGLQHFHPQALDKSCAEGERWEVGAWIGDFLGFFVDENGPYVIFYEVKESPEDHGMPGGNRINRWKPRLMERAQARRTVCACYAEQLDSRMVEVSTSQIPRGLALTLFFLCRVHNLDINLPDAAIPELLHAYGEAVGTDVPARDLARKLVGPDRLADAKLLLEVAVWERRVRVDLHQPLLFDHPLAPERQDVLVEFDSWFRRPS